HDRVRAQGHRQGPRHPRPRVPPGAADVTPGAWRRLGPAGLVCLAAPMFFVLGWTWAGWLLIAAGIGGALLAELGTPEPAVAVAAGGFPPWGIGEQRAPSLTRDLALIALGMLIVHPISLEAQLDDLA